MNQVRRIATLILLAFITTQPISAQDKSATAQLEESLHVIKAKDKHYKAVIAISPTARDDATALDRSGLGLLRGMPVLVKDNIAIHGLATTAGSMALSENFPIQDAPLITQLKDSGAVILGKTNLSEWANFRSEQSSSGWSAIGGQTGNAYNPLRSPCGSSAGSAVAVALAYVKVAIGTETNGSIVCPASINGVVGFKPTHGIVSGKGIIPLASTQDTAGPIANSIENASLVLSAMIKPTARNHDLLVSGLRELEAGEQLKNLRVGVLASSLGFDSRRDDLFNAAIASLKNAGVTVISDIQLSPYDNFGQESYQLLQYEFRRDLNNYLASLPNELTLEKLIKFNEENSDIELKHFDQSIFEKSQALKITNKQYQAILMRLKQATQTDGLDKVFAEHKLDAIIGITTGPAWLIDHINGDSFFGPSVSTYPAIAGNPHVTVPGGKIAGLPMGISFIGKRHQDHKLAQLVYRFTKL